MERMPFTVDDGGRAAAGFKGRAGDCVARAIAIASGRPYSEVYEALAAGTASERRTGRRNRTSGRRTAREGIHTSRQWFKDYMTGLGFAWTPTMKIGQGCKVHLAAGELPPGRLVVAVSGHYTAVVDGVIRDTHDPQRDGGGWRTDFNGASSTDDPRVTHRRIGGRCVYGYWTLAPAVRPNN